MQMKPHYNPKSLRWLISLAVMLVLTVCVVVGTVVATNISEKNSHEIIDFSFDANATAIPMAVEENELGVTGVGKIMDGGNVVAYVVTDTVTGYNQEVPIKMSVTLTKDAKAVAGIDILEQEETEYLGVRICTDDFKSQFDGKSLPIVSSSLEKGTKVDVISGSTISSKAAIDGVNNAMKYVQTYLAE